MFPTRKLAFLAAGLAMLLAAPSAAVAATDKGEATPLNLPSTDGSHATTSGGGGLVRTFVGLAIVLGVIYGLYWVLKQVKSSRESTASGQGLESVASLPLGTNRSLHLVRAGKELVLLGVAEQAVVPIRAYPEEEARALGLIGTGGDEVIEAGESAAPKVTPASAAVALRDVLGRIQQRTVRS
jgi:flagellar protein FliO/FliZ